MRLPTGSKRIVVSVAVIATLAFVLHVVGCGVTVTPPAAVGDPVTVFIADYGRHASLVIPAPPGNDGRVGGRDARRAGEDGAADEARGEPFDDQEIVLGELAPGEPRMWEYSYGDWSFYANDNDSLVNGAFVLLLPTRGALGRRAMPRATTEAGLRAAFDVGLEKVHVIAVERDAANALLERLHERWAAGEAYAGELSVSPVVNTAVNMRFVPDRASYSAFNHCNHALAGWLEELGAATSGNSLVSRYAVGKGSAGAEEDR